jgi:uncharacterized Zn finger protein
MLIECAKCGSNNVYVETLDYLTVSCEVGFTFICNECGTRYEGVGKITDLEIAEV